MEKRTKRAARTTIVDGEVVPKGRPRLGKKTVRTPAKTKNYEARVGFAFKNANPGWEPATCDVEVRVRIYRKSKVRFDIDNALKSILDGLNGVAYDDDFRVSYATVRRTYVYSKPAVSIEVVAREPA